jgi:tRNA U34 2-thiouridine synthase MnmA/TrmU
VPSTKSTKHSITANKLVIYQSERSTIWQCRYKVVGQWQRASTKEHELAKAKERAHELLIEAEIRKRSNIPVVIRRFRDVDKLAIKRLEDKIASNQTKVFYSDYKRMGKEPSNSTLLSHNAALNLVFDEAVIQLFDGSKSSKA